MRVFGKTSAHPQNAGFRRCGVIGRAGIRSTSMISDEFALFGTKEDPPLPKPMIAKKGALLAARIDGLLDEFVGRILAFDASTARCYVDLAVKARAGGKGSPTPDGNIAAIAAAHGFTAASRHTSAFTAASPTVIDPFAAPAD